MIYIDARPSGSRCGEGLERSALNNPHFEQILINDAFFC